MNDLILPVLVLEFMGTTTNNFSKTNHSRIKDIDLIMPKFDTVLYDNSSDLH